MIETPAAFSTNGTRASLPMPYKGLIPYTEQDAPFFFGREAEQQLIIANLMATRLTLLFGASGVGKSSLLRAGVAHELRRQATRRLRTAGSPESAVVVFSAWRDDPVSGLADAVHAAVRHAWQGDAGAPRVRRPLLETLQSSAEFVDGDLVILLDQFEEYFLYHPHEDGEGTFATEFPRVVAAPGLRANFLIAIREDALAKLDRFEGRIPNLFANYLRIEHLDRAAARAAIERPIERYNRLAGEIGQAGGVTIEADLVEEVLDEVRIGRVVLGESGRGTIEEISGRTADAAPERIETPYLQLVMIRLWSEDVEQRPDEGSSVVRLDTLRRLGGADRIVRTHLDATMSALSPAERDVAAHAFHYLVTPSGTKIAHSVSDIADYSGLPESDIAPVMEKLAGAEARVLLPVAPPLDRPSIVRYEIFHDVLAAAILDWRSRYAQAQELQAAAADAEQRLAQERGRVLRLRLVLAGVCVVLLAVVGLAVFAFQQSQAAQNAQRVASAHGVAARAISQLSTQPDLSLLLALEAATTTRTSQTEAALRAVLLDPTRAVLRGHTGPINSVAFSRDGSRVVTASRDGTARVWDVANGRSLAELRGHTRQVTSAAFNPDATLVVTASEDNTARLWQTATAQQIAEFRGHRVSVNGPAFSPDNRLLVTISDTTAQVWDVVGRQAVAELTGHTGLVTSATFSRDGTRIVTASLDGTARVWNVTDGRQLAELSGHAGSVNTAVFDPDGKRAVTASRDQTARVWDVATGRLLIELAGHADAVNAATFSADGKRVVTASDDHTARVWEASTGRRLAELRGHGGLVTSATFGADSRFVLTGSTDGAARLWDASSQELLAQLRGHTGAVTGVAFSPDGRFALTGSDDGTARYWAAVTGQSELELRGHTNGVVGAAFSPDGSRLVSASLDGSARVWDVTSGKQLADLAGHAGLVSQALFSPDGASVATASDDHTARIWQSSSGGLATTLTGHGGFVNSVAFSPDGKRLLTASWDGTARIWNAADSASVLELRGHSAPVEEAVFSSDGRLVATASRDWSARVWDASTGQSRVQMTGHTGAVVDVSFSGDGGRLVTASEDGTARVWDADTGQSEVELRGHARELTVAAFSPDASQVLTASGDGTARLWDPRTGGVLVELRGHAGPIGSASFSPDGKFVVTGSEDRTARVWDAATGNLVAELRGATAEVASAAFGRGNTTIATASRDGIARLYTCEACGSLDQLLALARSRVTRSLTPSERARYLDEVPVR